MVSPGQGRATVYTLGLSSRLSTADRQLCTIPSPAGTLLSVLPTIPLFQLEFLLHVLLCLLSGPLFLFKIIYSALVIS